MIEPKGYRDIPIDAPSLTELQKKFEDMSPKDRNERLQALYSAFIARSIETGEIDEFALTAYKSLLKSFEVSIQFQDREDDCDRDLI